MFASWKSLSISSPDTAKQPPLFISATFASNSYTIQITDLTRLWTESLDRKAIIKRSFQQDTAIDPSEDAEQMRLFLQKIEAGIRGDEHTEITLDYDPKTSTPDAPSLKVLITAHLPKPLRPLKWPVSLVQSDLSSFTEKITIPLLAAQNARIRETESLMEVLKDKDHVIQKLVDKLEANGTDLGHVFPILAMKGGRKPSRAQAEEKVKGIGMFDKARWKRNITEKQSVGDLRQLATRAFSADDSFGISHSEEYSIPEPWKIWWEEFGGSSGKKLGRVSNKAQSTVRSPSVEINEDQIEEEGDFQVQSTPPPQMQNSNNKRPSTTLDDSTDDDDDLDAPSQRSVVPDSFPIHAPPKSDIKVRKLGVIGKAKSSIERPPVPPAEAHVNDATASEDEITNSPPPPSRPEPKATTPVRPKKGGLGRIGGRKREVTPLPPPVQVESESQKDHDGALDAKPKKTPKKLGVIGRKAQRSPPVSPVGGVGRETRGRSPVAEEKEDSPPRETSAERALKKREEIQRELSEKAKKPVKKKRRF